MDKKSAIAHPGAEFSSYPKMRLRIRLSAPERELSRTRASGTPPHARERDMAIDVEPGEVGKMMAALGWESVGAGEADLAAESLSCLVEAMIESAARMCGYELTEVPRASLAMARMGDSWRDCLEGRRPWDSGQVGTELWVECSMRMPISHAGESSLPGKAERGEDHEARSQAVAATIVEQCSRLGAAASLGWTRGFGAWREVESRLPRAWSWPKSGAALCVELQDQSLACAGLSKNGVSRLAKSPLGWALGPGFVFALLASSRPLRIVCGYLRASRSYSRFGLPGMPEVHYPCQTLLARSEWRGKPGATPAEAMAALAEVAGPRGTDRLDWVGPSGEDSMMMSEGMRSWLASVEAGFQARALEKAIGRPGKAGARSQDAQGASGAQVRAKAGAKAPGKPRL